MSQSLTAVMKYCSNEILQSHPRCLNCANLILIDSFVISKMSLSCCSWFCWTQSVRTILFQLLWEKYNMNLISNKITIPYFCMTFFFCSPKIGNEKLKWLQILPFLDSFFPLVFFDIEVRQPSYWEGFLIGIFFCTFIDRQLNIFEEKKV